MRQPNPMRELAADLLAPNRSFVTYCTYRLHTYTPAYDVSYYLLARVWIPTYILDTTNRNSTFDEHLMGPDL